ncbi:hypothetical protein IEO21_02588 [Rhodonia placenta]|uniref:RRM domain-containing protein n=1 Tax=Rhodonia placenta TaxID=104341 RepID=A0A8H7P7H3_9APHY|nr:hypothetical protein IEO21_02588 [Postia placenta]
MSLNEFLGDSALGSWADEMDALPTAPAARADGDNGRPDRRRDDFLSSRQDRGLGPVREDLPLPTEPPYTAFIGNLAFDLTESELEEFFPGISTKSVKIIRDRDDKPKGFGYIEFVDLDGLKEALAMSGTSFAGRAIRVSVAEPPKERSGFGGGGFDDEKFAGPWRRDGPLPDLPSDRDGPRRRLDGPGTREPAPPSVSDTTSDWRSASRGPVRSSTASSLDSDPGAKRRSTFREGASTGADTEETWTIGAKFRPSAPAEPAGRFGAGRGRGDMGPPRDAQTPPDEGDWRRPSAISRNSTSPSSSTPPTPQMGRRKLELLPRSSSGASATPSPLASPNPSTQGSAQRSNPFGAAKPVDTVAKELAVSERLEKERELTKDRVVHTMSRTSSRQASHRGVPRTTPPVSSVTSPTSPNAELHKNAAPSPSASANVRPSFSFAHAAASKKDAASESGDTVEEVTEKIDEVQI